MNRGHMLDDYEKLQVQGAKDVLRITALEAERDRLLEALTRVGHCMKDAAIAHQALEGSEHS